MLLSQDVMMYAHFETDVTSLLSKLSQFMQQETSLANCTPQLTYLSSIKHGMVNVR